MHLAEQFYLLHSMLRPGQMSFLWGPKGQKARRNVILPRIVVMVLYGFLLYACCRTGRYRPSHIADEFTVTCRTTMRTCRVHCPQNASRSFSHSRCIKQVPLVHKNPYTYNRITRSAASLSVTCFQDTVRRAASIPEIKVIVLRPLIAECMLPWYFLSETSSSARQCLTHSGQSL